MFKRLSVKLAVYIMAILILVLGGASLVYSLNAKQLYINSEKTRMLSAVENLNKLKISNSAEDTAKISEFLDDNYEQTYDLYICDDEITPIFSSKRMFYTTSYIIKENFIDKIDKFKENNKPIFVNEKGRPERLVLSTKIKNHGKTFYVLIEESLRISDSVFKYTNSFLTIMVIAFIAFSGVAVLILINRNTRSLRELSEVAKKISQGDYSVRYNGKIKKDEVGVLAKNLNFMADTIAKNINNLNNYNFLLKEDNSRMTEYESMRKRVLTNVTHELKTPLAIISSQIEMMNCTKDEKKKVYYYESTMEEIDKMSKLISRLLNFSAGEKTIFENEKQDISLNVFVEKLCEKSQSLIKSKKIKFEKDFDECLVNASKEHIEHIFNNFLMNAVNYSKQNGLIKVSVKKFDNRCRIAVFNKGSNVKEEDSEKIWTDFYKTAAVEDDSKRAGIGLFIVKEISIINHDKCGFDNFDDGVEFWYDFYTYEV